MATIELLKTGKYQIVSPRGIEATNIENMGIAKSLQKGINIAIEGIKKFNK